MRELNIIYKKKNYELLLGDYYFLKCLKLLLVIFFLCMYCLCFLLNYLVNISENLKKKKELSLVVEFLYFFFIIKMLVLVF